MRCKNCGAELKPGINYCIECGTYNDEDDIESDGRSFEKQEASIGGFFPDLKKEKKQKEKKEKKKPEKKEERFVPEEVKDDIDEDDPYMQAFIGEDYKWVAQRPFNIYALLLSWVYFLYRKVYAIGIMGLVVTGAILVTYPIIMVPYIVLSMVFSGLFFNKIYLNRVESKVSKIKILYSDLSEEEKLLKCKKAGGVNVILPLLIFAIFLIVLLSNYIHLDVGHKKSAYWSENSDNQANCKSLGKRVYNSIYDYGVEGEIEELACEIVTTPDKTYNIYLKLQDGEKMKYVFFQTDRDGYFSIKANTELIEELDTLQKEYGLSQSNQEFLALSKELQKTYDSVKDEANYEDALIEKSNDKKAKTHFIFTKDDILN